MPSIRVTRVFSVSLLSCMVPCIQPNHLCLVLIQLQAIAGHPVTNLYNAVGQALHCRSLITCLRGDKRSGTAFQRLCGRRSYHCSRFGET